MKSDKGKKSSAKIEKASAHEADSKPVTKSKKQLEDDDDDLDDEDDTNIKAS